MTQTPMPDITPAQVAAIIGAIVTQLVSYGLLDQATGREVVSLAGVVIPAAWMIADAIIRHGRSRMLAPPPVTLAGVPAPPDSPTSS